MDSSTSLLATIILTLVTAIGYFLYSRYKLFRVLHELGFPGPKPHFLKGNASEVTFGSLQPIESFLKWKEQYGKVFGYYQGTVPTVVVGDVDLLKQIAIKDFGNFANRWRPPLANSNKKSISLLDLTGQRWKDVRKILTPSFSASKLRQLTPLMKTAVSDFDSCLNKVAVKDVEFDIYDKFQRLTLDVIGQSALAMKINCQDDEQSQLYKQVNSIMRAGITARNSKVGLLLTYFPELFVILKYSILQFPIFRSVGDVIKNLYTVLALRRRQSDHKTVDMLQLMLDASGEAHSYSSNSTLSVEPLKDQEIVGNCFVFLLAGFETTATTLAYVVYMLSTHLDIQEKVHEEISSEIKDLSNVTYEDANNLNYLDQVINETIRLYPPVWAINRLCTQDYELMGKIIPKGMKVEFPIHLIHHDPELWPEPEKFDPERFSPENKGKIHPAAHIPFGIGPRSCIGIRFALLEIKLTLITLLNTYRLVPALSAKFPPEFTVSIVTYVPKHGVFVKAISRNNA